MGNLHDVFQIKSKVVSGSAILKVKKDQEAVFSSVYLLADRQYDDNEQHWGLFSNTVAQHSVEGKVDIFGMYQSDRTIDFKTSGIYILIRSGSKYGFDSDFDAFLAEMAAFLEDALFYVLYVDTISEYEISNGVLKYQMMNASKRWNSNAETYILSNYAAYPQVITDYYMEELLGMKMRVEEYIAEGEDEFYIYDREDYADFLDKIQDYTAFISNETDMELMKWLEAKIRI